MMGMVSFFSFIFQMMTLCILDASSIHKTTGEPIGLIAQDDQDDAMPTRNNISSLQCLAVSNLLLPTQEEIQELTIIEANASNTSRLRDHSLQSILEFKSIKSDAPDKNQDLFVNLIENMSHSGECSIEFRLIESVYFYLTQTQKIQNAFETTACVLFKAKQELLNIEQESKHLKQENDLIAQDLSQNHTLEELLGSNMAPFVKNIIGSTAFPLTRFFTFFSFSFYTGTMITLSYLLPLSSKDELTRLTLSLLIFEPFFLVILRTIHQEEQLQFDYFRERQELEIPTFLLNSEKKENLEAIRQIAEETQRVIQQYMNLYPRIESIKKSPNTEDFISFRKALLKGFPKMIDFFEKLKEISNH